MSARIIDGKQVAADLRGKIAAEVTRLRSSVVPGIAVVLVGENPASEVYVRTKSKAVGEAGSLWSKARMPASPTAFDFVRT